MYFLTYFILILATSNAAPVEDEVETLIDDMIFLGDPFKTARNANMKQRKWDNGVILYSFDASSAYTKSEKDLIIKSMKKIEQQTNNVLSFKERTNETNYIEFKDTNTGCNSYVGRTGRSAQRVSLQRPNCIFQSVIIHELLHVAGFEHEQCRSDRDKHVEILYENIDKAMTGNFVSFSETVVNSFGLPYDYFSIMHYSWNAFSSNGLATIEPLDRGIDKYKMGKRNDLSTIDIEKIKIFYNSVRKILSRNLLILLVISLALNF
jgi:hypothetical protein